MMTLVFKMLKKTEKLSHQFQIYPIALVQVCASSEYLVTLSDDIKPDDYNSDLSIVTGSCLSWFLFFPQAVSSHQAAQRPHRLSGPMMGDGPQPAHTPAHLPVDILHNRHYLLLILLFYSVYLS